jgi:hypothetical protein
MTRLEIATSTYGGAWRSRAFGLMRTRTWSE